MKPLKFDPIEVTPGLTVQSADPRLAPGVVMLESTNFGIRLNTAEVTAALIAALQVAHKAQLEAETLTLRELETGEWFRLPDDNPAWVCRKTAYHRGHNCVVVTEDDVFESDVAPDATVIRVRATFEDLP